MLLCLACTYTYIWYAHGMHIVCTWYAHGMHIYIYIYGVYTHDTKVGQKHTHIYGVVCMRYFLAGNKQI